MSALDHYCPHCERWHPHGLTKIPPGPAFDAVGIVGGLLAADGTTTRTYGYLSQRFAHREQRRAAGVLDS